MYCLTLSVSYDIKEISMEDNRCIRLDQNYHLYGNSWMFALQYTKKRSAAYEKKSYDYYESKGR